MKKSQEPQIDLEDEYMRILANEMIYFDEIALWDKLEKITVGLMAISFVPMVIPTFSLPQNISILELFADYPLQATMFFFGFGLFLASAISKKLLSDKISKIRDELDLHREERLYLRAYETYKTIDSFLNEPNACMHAWQLPLV